MRVAAVEETIQFAETCGLRMEDGGFGVGEFFVAAVVAAGVDELNGGGKIDGGRAANRDREDVLPLQPTFAELEASPDGSS